MSCGSTPFQWTPLLANTPPNLWTWWGGKKKKPFWCRQQHYLSFGTTLKPSFVFQLSISKHLIVTLSSDYESVSNRIESCASHNAAPEGLPFNSNVAFSKVVFPFFICSTRVLVFHCCYSWIVIYYEMECSPLVSLFDECVCYLYWFFFESVTRGLFVGFNHSLFNSEAVCSHKISPRIQ